MVGEWEQDAPAMLTNIVRSSPVNIQDIGIIHLRVPKTSDDNQVDIVTADIKINGSTIFVTFLKADGWPFELENDSDCTVFVCQWVISLSTSSCQLMTVFRTRLEMK